MKSEIGEKNKHLFICMSSSSFNHEQYWFVLMAKFHMHMFLFKYHVFPPPIVWRRMKKLALSPSYKCIWKKLLQPPWSILKLCSGETEYPQNHWPLLKIIHRGQCSKLQKCQWIYRSDHISYNKMKTLFEGRELREYNHDSHHEPI